MRFLRSSCIQFHRFWVLELCLHGDYTCRNVQFHRLWHDFACFQVPGRKQLHPTVRIRALEAIHSVYVGSATWFRKGSDSVVTVIKHSELLYEQNPEAYETRVNAKFESTAAITQHLSIHTDLNVMST